LLFLAFPQILEEPKDSVTSLDVSDHEILAGSADAKVRRYDLRNGQLFTGKSPLPTNCKS
jgi:mitogen-activated protein kinase organizer 1